MSKERLLSGLNESESVESEKKSWWWKIKRDQKRFW